MVQPVVGYWHLFRPRSLHGMSLSRRTREESFDQEEGDVTLFICHIRNGFMSKVFFSFPSFSFSSKNQPCRYSSNVCIVHTFIHRHTDIFSH